LYYVCSPTAKGHIDLTLTTIHLSVKKIYLNHKNIKSGLRPLMKLI